MKMNFTKTTPRRLFAASLACQPGPRYKAPRGGNPALIAACESVGYENAYLLRKAKYTNIYINQHFKNKQIMATLCLQKRIENERTNILNRVNVSLLRRALLDALKESDGSEAARLEVDLFSKFTNNFKMLVNDDPADDEEKQEIRCASGRHFFLTAQTPTARLVAKTFGEWLAYLRQEYNTPANEALRETLAPLSRLLENKKRQPMTAQEKAVRKAENALKALGISDDEIAAILATKK